MVEIVGTNYFNFPPTTLIVLALGSALAYKFLSNISTNSYVPAVLGLILIFIGRGGVISTVGAGVLGLAISRVIGKDVFKFIGQVS